MMGFIWNHRCKECDKFMWTTLVFFSSIPVYLELCYDCSEGGEYMWYKGQKTKMTEREKDLIMRQCL